MDTFKWAELRAMTDALKKRGEALKLKIPPERVRDHIGEAYVQMLERLTEAEAVSYLKSVHESKVLQAYWVLSKRLSRNVLAEICLAYLAHPAVRTRLTGALGIGTCLKRTRNEKASHALALIIRNPQEDKAVRQAAYSSLELIHWRTTSRSLGRVQDDNELERILQAGDWLQTVDWTFVDSFL